MADTATTMPPHVPSSGGAIRLASDLRLTFALLNEARYRALASAFGCSRSQANLATLVGALALLEAMGHTWRRLMSLPVVPTLPEGMFASAALRQLVTAITGPTIGDSPQLGPLLVVAFVGTAAGPTVIRSLRGVKNASARLDHAFRHRYGYLVDPGHRRQRHYEAQGRRRLPAAKPVAAAR